MVDWFYGACGAVVVGHLVLGCCSLCCTTLTLALMAALRFLIIPAECDLTLWLYQRFGRPVESLKGQVVWITGASMGIGAALAVRLARAGVRLVLSARSKQGLQEVKMLCVATGGVEEGDILVLPLDMTDFHHHQTTFDQVISHFGKLDILVSNAGRSQRGQWEKIEIDVDRALFDLNVFSLISLSRIAVRYFLTRGGGGGGHLVVTSSVTGKVAGPLSASYNASKYALHGYFETLRVEHVGDGVGVTMVCPGPVESNILNLCFTERHGETLGLKRAGRRMTSERCAELFAVAIANRLSEVWISEQPILILTYIGQYFPSTMKSFMNILPLKVIMKLRDGKDVMKEKEQKEH